NPDGSGYCYQASAGSKDITDLVFGNYQSISGTKYIVDAKGDRKPPSELANGITINVWWCVPAADQSSCTPDTLISPPQATQITQNDGNGIPGHWSAVLPAKDAAFRACEVVPYGDRQMGPQDSPTDTTPPPPPPTVPNHSRTGHGTTP